MLKGWRSSGAGGSSTISDCFTYPRRSDDPFNAILFSNRIVAKELRPHNVAAVSIWMGPLDTERARAHIASLPPDGRPTQQRESPQFTGQVIAALYRSSELMALSGRALIGAELGAYFGVTDI